MQTNRPAAIILLVLISITHYAYGPLSQIGSTPARWFYVLRGFEGCVLFGLLSLVCRDRVSRWLCYWGIAESALTAGCGSFRLFGSIPTLRATEGICDAYGIHTYWLGLAIAAVFALIIWRSNG